MFPIVAAVIRKIQSKAVKPQVSRENSPPSICHHPTYCLPKLHLGMLAIPQRRNQTFPSLICFPFPVPHKAVPCDPSLKSTSGSGVSRLPCADLSLLAPESPCSAEGDILSAHIMSLPSGHALRHTKYTSVACPCVYLSVYCKLTRSTLQKKQLSLIPITVYYNPAKMDQQYLYIMRL